MKSVDRFDDVNAHAAAIKHWNQTYSQISAGPVESSLIQVASPRCYLFRERINQRVVQEGEAPAGKICFAIPIAATESAHLQGRKTDCNSVFFLQGGEDFLFHMPKGMDMLSINFERDLFESALETVENVHEVKAALTQPIIKLPKHRLAACRNRLLAIFSEAFSDSAGSGLQLDKGSFEQIVLHEILTLISIPGYRTRRHRGSSTQSFIVEKCHRQAMVECIDFPSVMELCEQLKVSRRTVQNSFRSVTGTTPLNYLRSVRLNGVRRSLMSTSPSKLLIGNAASRWGFFHMSHFATAYLELFGELPSHTRRLIENRE
ncbi:helix-turn-helix domain-containing protein [Burkholderia multivorans]|uniref:helix-turn-helix domain-containing protein n=1 Tax=Burkholderia multivorans TaxID=87883 RepID=UPI002018E234|nr:helix-turn-helix domain-containing protein [Burkholderia multivorans]MCA8143550.1 helix-turn-helix domain-containing protein [Burkholderia multivorans]MCO1368560.1 helix-turn-helix domain-containing protein [Burkholderia multivorans]MCO1380451.1 helix-turn-helix domain-containing protein [Burkholderia multivorans]MDN8032151.1 helix-turn-helix domain-containing protein [Burkholderia multivorans]UQP21440.1 helix-turn-helix domain-containing protein [Burkholderia multivorans]